jgi:hypothetical protein
MTGDRHALALIGIWTLFVMRMERKQERHALRERHQDSSGNDAMALSSSKSQMLVVGRSNRACHWNYSLSIGKNGSSCCCELARNSSLEAMPESQHVCMLNIP